LDWLKEQLGELEPEVTVAATLERESIAFELRPIALVAFERNIEYQMSENLKQAGGNQALEVPVKIEARLMQPAHVYDLRAGTYLGLTNRFISPWMLFSLLCSRCFQKKCDPIQCWKDWRENCNAISG
jgi:hypothetical protein